VKTGMSDCLSKPFTKEQLFTDINRNLKTINMVQDLSGPGVPPANGNTADKNALYDLTMIRSVSGGDEAFLTKMVRMFIETVPPGLHDLNQAVAGSEWERVSKMAHKLKSTIDSMGIDALKDDIRTIESNAKQQLETNNIPVLVEKVNEVVGQCVQQLKRDFSL